jgi:hypothetical protein
MKKKRGSGKSPYWFGPLVRRSRLPASWTDLSWEARGLASELLRHVPEDGMSLVKQAPWEAVATTMQTGGRGHRTIKRCVGELMEAGVLVQVETGLYLATPEHEAFPDTTWGGPPTDDVSLTYPRHFSDTSPALLQHFPPAKPTESLGSEQYTILDDTILKNPLPPEATPEPQEPPLGVSEQTTQEPTSPHPPRPRLQLGPDGYPPASELVDVDDTGKARAHRPPEAWILVEPEPDPTPVKAPTAPMVAAVEEAWAEAWRAKGKTAPPAQYRDLAAVATWATNAAKGPEGAWMRGTHPGGSEARKLIKLLIERYLADQDHFRAKAGHPFAAIPPDLARWATLPREAPSPLTGASFRILECYWALLRSEAHWSASKDKHAFVIAKNYAEAVACLVRGDLARMKPTHENVQKHQGKAKKDDHTDTAEGSENRASVTRIHPGRRTAV